MEIAEAQNSGGFKIAHIRDSELAGVQESGGFEIAENLRKLGVKVARNLS